MPWPKFNVFFFGRNTGSVVSARNPTHAIARAKSIGSTGSNGPVVGVTKLEGKDLATANSGKWVRTRVDGSRNSSVGDYLFRPGLKKVAKGKNF